MCLIVAKLTIKINYRNSIAFVETDGWTNRSYTNCYKTFGLKICFFLGKITHHDSFGIKPNDKCLPPKGYLKTIHQLLYKAVLLWGVTVRMFCKNKHVQLNSFTSVYYCNQFSEDHNRMCDPYWWARFLNQASN